MGVGLHVFILRAGMVILKRNRGAAAMDYALGDIEFLVNCSEFADAMSQYMT
jgi:hypothetical protein